jgi:ectoine hydroxylase-related dioxygenase (phytanoyl-CoA dioxygenase family)
MLVTDTAVPRTRSIEEAKKLLQTHGLAVVEGILDTEALDTVRGAVARGIEYDRQHDIQLQGFDFDPDDRNIRLFDLVNKEQVFRDLVEHPVALDFVRFWLGEPFSLSNFSGNITAPGSGAMGMHADAGYMPVPWPPYPIALNVAWAVDDFTADNGATRIVPGSYGKGFGPDYRASPHDPPGRETAKVIPVECPAGSIFVMDGRVWHQTGPNTTAATTRIGLFAYYTRPFIRPQYNWYATVPDAVLDSASPTLRRMLGFGDNLAAKAEYPQLRKQWLRRPRQEDVS